MASRGGELDTTLLCLDPWDHFTLRDTCQGVCIMGSIGSGKTPSSGVLSHGLLRAGMGGLVIEDKPELPSGSIGD